MPKINTNPNVETSSFSAVQPARYIMKVRTIEDRRPEKNDLHVSLEHTVPASELVGVDGNPLKGQPSMIHDYLSLDPEKQWKLRQIAEAAGLPWGEELDTDALVGAEVEMQIKIEEYNGEQVNRAGRYVKKGE